MAYCSNCGKELNENAPVCVNCGAEQTSQPQMNAQPQSYTYAQTYTQETKPELEDNGGFLWGLLGCCVPVAGLVLFLIWKDTKPKTAKAAGIGAIVFVVAYALFFIVYFLLLMIIGIGMAGIVG